LFDGTLVNTILQGGEGDMMSRLTPLIPFIAVAVIFYFLLILPQQRQRRKVEAMLSSLKTGDRVLTSGGIYGTVVGFRDEVVQLQIANQVRVDIARSAISSLQPASSDAGAGVKEAAKKEAVGKK